MPVSLVHNPKREPGLFKLLPPTLRLPFLLPFVFLGYMVYDPSSLFSVT